MGARFNEMVLYPNVQDAMFFGAALPIADLFAKRQRTDSSPWKHKKWERRAKSWNIKVIDTTEKDLEAHGEGKLFR